MKNTKRVGKNGKFSTHKKWFLGEDSMKALLKSETPKRCEQIANGKCTILLSKTKPKLEPPLKGYLYCVKDKYKHLYDLREVSKGEFILSVTEHNKTSLVLNGYLNGKVIGEYVVGEADLIFPEYGYLDARCRDGAGFILDKACISGKELMHFGNGKILHALHISHVKIYDKPKALGEFKTLKRCKDWQSFEMCSDVCGYAENNQCHDGLITKPIARPPKGWCYVEEMEYKNGGDKT